MTSPRSVLVIELLGGIGDVVLALPVVHAIARRHPAARVTVLTFPPGGQLLHADPLVDEVVLAERGGPDEVGAQVSDLLAARRFDLVVADTRYGDIPARVETAAPRRAVTDLWRSPPPDQLIDLRFLEILAAEGVIAPQDATLAPRLAVDAAQRGAARAWLAAHLPDGRPVAVVVPEAGMAIKEWGTARYRALAAALVERGVAVAVPTGARPELAAAVADGLPHVRVVPPRSLAATAALLAEADLCVGGDTGLARIAASAGTPTACLFGPTVSARFGLRPPHRNLDSPLPSTERRPLDMTGQACWWSGRCVVPDHRSCLDDITLDRVLDAALDLLAGPVEPPEPVRTAEPVGAAEPAEPVGAAERTEATASAAGWRP